MKKRFALIFLPSKALVVSAQTACVNRLVSRNVAGFLPLNLNSSSSLYSKNYFTNTGNKNQGKTGQKVVKNAEF